MKNSYSFSEKIDNVYSLVLTKIFFKKARLIRRPFYCRGRKNLQFGEGFTTGRNCRFDLSSEVTESSPTLKIGQNCRMGDNVHIVALSSVEIGSNVLMASKIFISDTNHGEYSNVNQLSSPYVSPNDRPLISQKVKIGDNVWIGENVVILAGVTIGSGCILGANSVITKSIERNSIVAGIPGKVIKRYDTATDLWVK